MFERTNEFHRSNITKKSILLYYNFVIMEKTPVNPSPKNDQPQDFTNGDHSFKNWFKLMFSNGYIQICFCSLFAIIIGIFNFSWCWDTITSSFVISGFAGVCAVIFFLIPPAIFIVTAYKGLYQYWQDEIHGRSR